MITGAGWAATPTAAEPVGSVLDAAAVLRRGPAYLTAARCVVPRGRELVLVASRLLRPSRAAPRAEVQAALPGGPAAHA